MKKSLRILDSTGDTVMSFESEIDDKARAEAEKFFQTMKQKGAAVISVTPGTEGGVQVRDFNTLGEENVVIQPIVGG